MGITITEGHAESIQGLSFVCAENIHNTGAVPCRLRCAMPPPPSFTPPRTQISSLIQGCLEEGWRKSLDFVIIVVVQSVSTGDFRDIHPIDPVDQALFVVEPDIE